MRNPLNKRLPRELKHDFGKYLVIFLFMVMMISLVSGFLVADNSVKHSYDEGFEKYNLEDGHFALDKEPDSALLKDIESQYYNEQDKPWSLNEIKEFFSENS